MLLTEWFKREFSKANIKVKTPLITPVELREFQQKDKSEGIHLDEEIEESAPTDGDDDVYDVDFFTPVGSTELPDASNDNDEAETPADSSVENAPKSEAPIEAAEKAEGVDAQKNTPTPRVRTGPHTIRHKASGVE